MVWLMRALGGLLGMAVLFYALLGVLRMLVDRGPHPHGYDKRRRG